MGILNKLFGKPKPKKSIESSTPFHNLPSEWIGEKIFFSDKLRVDAIMLLAHAKKIGYEKYDLLFMKLTDDSMFQVPLVFYKNEERIPVFYFYTEEEAKSYPLYEKILLDDGFNQPLYISKYDVKKYSIADVKLPTDLSFTAFFKYDKELGQDEFAGQYSMWCQTENDRSFLQSPMLPVLTNMYEKMDRFESIFGAILVSDILEKEDISRMRLPKEEATIRCLGPEGQKCLLSFGAEKGIRVLMPNRTSFKYKQRLLSQMDRSITLLRNALDAKGAVPDDYLEENPIGWFKFMIRAMKDNNMSPVQVGGCEIFEKNKFEKIEGIDLDKVIPRVKVRIEGNKNATIQKGKSVDMPKEMHPVFMPFQSDFEILFAIDQGENYQFINQETLDGSPEVTLETLYNHGIANVLKEVQSNTRMHGNVEDGLVMIANGGNHESTMIIFDDFWNQIETQFGTDICMVAPVRDILYVGNFYKADVLDKMRDAIRKFFYDPNQRGILSNGIYLRKEGQWKRIETVEPIL